MARTIDKVKKIHGDTKFRMYLSYKAALAWGFSDRKAKGWAVYAEERQRQGVRDPGRLHPSRFRTSKYCDHQIYDRLVGREVPSGYFGWYTRLNEGIENFCRITDLDRTWLLAYAEPKELEIIGNSWLQTTRARDLFISGLGSFDCVKVFSELANTIMEEKRWSRFSLNRGMMVAYGYFGISPMIPWAVRTWLDYCRESKACAQYTKRHVEWFRQHPYDIDELIYYRTHNLNAQYENWGSPEEVCFIVGGNNDDAIQLEEKVIQFPVEPLSISPPGFDPEVTLEVITDSARLSQVAGELHNCARSYIEECRQLYSLMVVLTRAGKVLALGQFETDGLSQLAGPCNQPVHRWIQDIYTSYTKTFVDWLDKACKDLTNQELKQLSA